jgi:DNA-binding HxlR family transcriptional regulator
MSARRHWKTTPAWNVFDSHCPAPVIRRLSNGTLRFAQLRRTVAGISQKVLTNAPRGLARDGIVTRRIYDSVPPNVEGSLTSLGRS